MCVIGIYLQNPGKKNSHLASFKAGTFHAEYRVTDINPVAKSIA